MTKIKRSFAVLMALALTASASVPAFEHSPAAIYASAAEVSQKTIDLLSKEYRQHVLNRETEFTMEIPYDVFVNDQIDTFMAQALEETGVGNEGDYLRWTIKMYRYGINVSGGKTTIRYEMTYNTTAAQEAETDKKVKEIISKLDLKSGSEYDRIKAAYDYVKTNVKYAEGVSGDSRYIFTAYGAAVKGEAVCQGYALLLYRLLRELGIECRAIPGAVDGANHMWNIAAINGTYYYLDCTFDSTIGGSQYYFLRGSRDFDDFKPDKAHVFKPDDSGGVLSGDYGRGDFFTLHPIAVTACDPSTVLNYTVGDVNGDGAVDSSDASAVLAAYAMLSTTGSSGLGDWQVKAADTDHNGAVNSADASAILSYYALVSTGRKISPAEYFFKG